MGLFTVSAPLLIAIVLTAAAFKRVDVIAEFSEGAMEGLRSAVGLLPTLMLVVTAVSFAYRSGALGALAELAAPALEHIGIDGNTVPLALIRPVSGSGALAVYNSIITDLGPDSTSGRIATVLMGSTETTFYTIAVYFSAVKLKAEARVFISSLTADAAGFFFSAAVVKLFY